MQSSCLRAHARCSSTPPFPSTRRLPSNLSTPERVHQQMRLLSSSSHLCSALPFVQLFDPVLANFDPAIRRRLETRPLRDELLQLLTGQDDTGPSQASRISELVEDLSSGGTPFDEKLLGGGPWQVRAYFALFFEEGLFLHSSLKNTPVRVLFGVSVTPEHTCYLSVSWTARVCWDALATELEISLLCWLQGMQQSKTCWVACC